MKKEFTPGPWRVGDAGATVFGPKTNAPAPKTVCTMSRSMIVGAESKANARLIAQAPALLDTCAKLLEWIDNLEKQGYQDELINAMPNNFGRQVAREVIVQATGDKE